MRFCEREWGVMDVAKGIYCVSELPQVYRRCEVTFGSVELATLVVWLLGYVV